MTDVIKGSKWNQVNGLTANGIAIKDKQITNDVTQDELQSRKMNGKEWTIRIYYGQFFMDEARHN